MSADDVTRGERPGTEGHAGEEEPPRGALTFILIYLVVLVVFWINTYLRLWLRE